MQSRRVLASAATAAAVSLPSFYVYKTDDSLNRALRFYSVAVPAYLHYEFADRWYSGADPLLRDRIFNQLHDKYSPIMRSHVLKMRGFFLKAAQLMSVREDYLPPQYLEWTSAMQSEAPVTFSPDEAKAIVCSELGLKRIEDTFAEWTDEPIGSASIGQVYRAKLRESNTVVAVKVQSPNVEAQFRSDLRACKLFCRVALPHLVVSLEEIERQFLTEFDYSLEAQNLDQVRRNLTEVGGWGSKVVVPRPHHELCTKRVLVMDFVEGRRVIEIFRDFLEKMAKNQNKSLDQIKRELTQWILKQGLTNVAERKWSIDLHRWTRSFVRITTFGFFGQDSDLPVNPVDLLETAMKVHGHQIFVDAAFNGDPHPGNLMVTPEGKLGLIDFGQVKRLSPQRLEQFARLVIALNDEDRDRVCAIAREIGCENVKNEPDVVYRLTAFWLDRDTPDITGGLDIHKFLEEMEKRDPQKSLCQDLVMVGRCSVMLRSLGLSLGLRVRTTDYWRPYAEDYLRRYHATSP